METYSSSPAMATGQLDNMNIVGIIFPKQLHQKSCNLIKVKSNYVCVIFTHTKIYMISV